MFPPNLNTSPAPPPSLPPLAIHIPVFAGDGSGFTQRRTARTAAAAATIVADAPIIQREGGGRSLRDDVDLTAGGSSGGAILDKPTLTNEGEEEDGGFIVVTMTPSASAASATSTAVEGSAAGPHRGGGDGENGDCRLMGQFAILVQLALGGLALMSLVYKRWRERPQRPVKIWFFDVSKQVFGSVLVHAANVFMSLLTSGRFSIENAAAAAVSDPGTAVRRAVLELVKRGHEATGEGGEPYVPNPCSFYLLNLAIDVSFFFPSFFPFFFSPLI